MFRKFIIRLLKIVLVVALVLVIALAGFLGYFTVTEYYPDGVEPINVPVSHTAALSPDKEIRLMTWNIGYAGLNKDADFFMDGGANVESADKATVNATLNRMAESIEAERPTILLLQEVDTIAKRTHKINEKAFFDKALQTGSVFAHNFKTFVPYPIPDMIGKVESGLYTASEYPLIGAERHQLPVPFKWPVRLFNLKRCLLVSRFALENSDRELVVVNLHLEAYDDTGGREAQTAYLIEFMRDEYAKGNYVVAGGDWNQSFYRKDEMPFLSSSENWEPGYVRDAAIPDDWHLIAGDPAEMIPTCRLLDKPYQPDDPNTVHYIIDGYLCTPNIEILESKVLDRGFADSDHNPVLLTFRMKP